MTLPASHPKKVAKREEKQKNREEKAKEKERRAKEREESKKNARRKEIGVMLRRVSRKEAQQAQDFLESVGVGGIRARDAKAAGLNNQEIRLLKRISAISSGAMSDKAMARLTRQLQKSGTVGQAFLKTFASEKGARTSRILIDRVAGKLGSKKYSENDPGAAKQILARAAQITAAHYIQDRIKNKTPAGINQYARKVIMTITGNIVRPIQNTEQRREAREESKAARSLKKSQISELQAARERAKNR